MKSQIFAALLAFISLPIAAQQIVHKPQFPTDEITARFDGSCDAVWKAARSVAETPLYRVLSVDQAKLMSLEIAGALAPELKLVLRSDGENCLATIKTLHCGGFSDCRSAGLTLAGPDLMARIGAEILAEQSDRNSPAFQRYEQCVEGSYKSAPKCEKKLRRELAVALP